MLALSLQEDGGATAAGAPTVEELHSEGEFRPKERWSSSRYPPERALEDGALAAADRVVVSLVEAEGSGDRLGTLPAPTVFWDPDLASLEDPVRECAQCHCLPRPVHPGAAPLLYLPPTWG